VNTGATTAHGAGRWAVLAAAAGFLSFLITAVGAAAWYADVRCYTWAQFGPTFLRMTALYVVLLAGPALMFFGGALALAGARGDWVRWCALIGGTLTLAFSLLGLALGPPDVPIRVVVGGMGVASLALVVLTLRAAPHG
jgi:hypothetical protein